MIPAGLFMLLDASGTISIRTEFRKPIRFQRFYPHNTYPLSPLPAILPLSCNNPKGRQTMSVVRVGECRAKEGQAVSVAEFVQSVIVAGVKASPGCQDCYAWQSQDDPARFMIVELWESVEAHSNAVMQIDPADIARFREIVAEMTSSGYFDEVR
jgi:hypothetical protein